MSFYSHLMLFADSEVSGLSEKTARALMAECELLADPNKESSDILAMDVRELFEDEEAIEKNESYFHPDSISYGNELELYFEELEEQNEDFDGTFVRSGHVFLIHGYGYFYPRTKDEINERILSHEKLRRLRSLLSERHGGHCSEEVRKVEGFDRVLIDDSSPWIWIGYEN